MKISQSGHSLDISLSLGLGGARLLNLFCGDLLSASGCLFGVGDKPLTEPGAVVPCLYPGAEPVLIARAISSDDVEEFGPVWLAEVIAAFLLIPLEVWIGDGQPEVLCLRYRLVDELLAQLVVSVHLDLPGH